MAQQFSFLEQFVKEVLQQNGFDKLTEEDQKIYFPQFMVEAERRLGLTLMPHIKSPTAGDQLKKLLQTDATPEAWSNFWRQEVPNFDKIVGDALQSFAKEVAASFS